MESILLDSGMKILFSQWNFNKQWTQSYKLGQMKSELTHHKLYLLMHAAYKTKKVIVHLVLP